MLHPPINSTMKSKSAIFIASHDKRRRRTNSSPVVRGGEMEKLIGDLQQYTIQGFGPALKSERIIAAMRKVDRGKYVKQQKYINEPTDISHGQTISAPHMHAAALELLKDHLTEGSSALDVGSGSGYLTVCMARLVGILDDNNQVHEDKGKVAGIDVIPELVKTSKENVKNDVGPELLEADNFKLEEGDARKGFPPFAPYDAIHVAAAAPSVPPQALIDQLKPGGKMVIPVGPKEGPQDLYEVTKDASGHTRQKKIFGVRYVSLV
ncbi:unnamed protein product [Vitrella brassicaformis CCMP3155]|uniref:protein-L-isoaspartate(D-aspartate) O-methyltransferase n=1 Tax=Vitrella brassicaformis (strain CCMP3155) TaxID=1169540 RepID=A0A0G4ENE5_VITBC|nr:unnamed protein product [Vitrella brassicaformis CCMP3155]|eukprot:CEL98522.1 unnamed protein product [Vitrella brassicaformis CCMP3155]